tara:strand:+ start:34658 stop:35245 length:588 start_codon:yes stop_codon:yes gene_type:complete
MKIVFATNNANKLKEVQSQLPATIELLSLEDIGCTEDIPETSPTIKGNALQKANYIKNKFGYDCFADDTGLEVEVLKGEPGVYSARYAGEQKNADDNMNKLLAALEGKTNRKAQFKTVVALISEGNTQTFTGICKGVIITSKNGEKGFGYDPVFQPDGYDITFAEMDLETKNSIGHRGKAIRQLLEFLTTKKHLK